MLVRRTTIELRNVAPTGARGGDALAGEGPSEDPRAEEGDLYCLTMANARTTLQKLST